MNAALAEKHFKLTRQFNENIGLQKILLKQRACYLRMAKTSNSIYYVLNNVLLAEQWVVFEYGLHRANTDVFLNNSLVFRQVIEKGVLLHDLDELLEAMNAFGNFSALDKRLQDVELKIRMFSEGLFQLSMEINNIKLEINKIKMRFNPHPVLQGGSMQYVTNGLRLVQFTWPTGEEVVGDSSSRFILPNQVEKYRQLVLQEKFDYDRAIKLSLENTVTKSIIPTSAKLIIKNLECPICLAEIQPSDHEAGNVIVEKLCAHTYHLNCISHMLETDRQQGKASRCPVCRQNINIIPQEDLIIVDSRHVIGTHCGKCDKILFRDSDDVLSPNRAHKFHCGLSLHCKCMLDIKRNMKTGEKLTCQNNDGHIFDITDEFFNKINSSTML